MNTAISHLKMMHIITYFHQPSPPNFFSSVPQIITGQLFAQMPLLCQLFTLEIFKESECQLLSIYFLKFVCDPLSQIILFSSCSAVVIQQLAVSQIDASDARCPTLYSLSCSNDQQASGTKRISIYREYRKKLIPKLDNLKCMPNKQLIK